MTSGATLLLTATVVPGDVIFCDRRAVDVRLRDYLFAFRFWLGEKNVARILLVENSGFDLAPFRALAARHKRPDQDVELLGFVQPPFDPLLGKSYGEARIIAHALEASQLLASGDFVIKGTGRYFATNFFKVWPLIARKPLPFVLANFYRHPVECDSRFFGARVEFLRDYFWRAAQDVHDGEGRYFEHALAHAVTAAVDDGHSWNAFPGGGLLVDGVQASTNTAYRYPRGQRLFYRAIATLRNGVPFRTGLGAPEKR